MKKTIFSLVFFIAAAIGATAPEHRDMGTRMAKKFAAFRKKMKPITDK